MTYDRGLYWKDIADKAFDSGLTDELDYDQYCIVESISCEENISMRRTEDIGRLRKDLMDCEEIPGFEDLPAELERTIKEDLADSWFEGDWSSREMFEIYADEVWSGTAGW